jgi:hypothetical protein
MPPSNKYRKIPDSIIQGLYLEYRDEIKKSIENLHSINPSYFFTDDITDYMKSLDTRFMRGDVKGGIYADIASEKYWEENEYDAQAEYLPGGNLDDQKASLNYRMEITQDDEGELFRTPTDIKFEHGTPDTMRFNNYIFDDIGFGWGLPIWRKQLAETFIHEFVHGRPGRESDVYSAQSVPFADFGDKKLIDYKFLIADKDNPMGIGSGLTHDFLDQTDFQSAILLDALKDVDFTDEGNFPALQKLIDWQSYK